MLPAGLQLARDRAVAAARARTGYVVPDLPGRLGHLRDARRRLDPGRQLRGPRRSAARRASASRRTARSRTPTGSSRTPSINCAGGPTPWGTWLSCEEVDDGLVWECDPTGATRRGRPPGAGRLQARGGVRGPRAPARLPQRGPQRRRPVPLHARRRIPTCRAGRSRSPATAAAARSSGRRCRDPAAAPRRRATRSPGKLPFARGEGIWFDAGIVYLATTADETIHAYDTRTQTIEVLYRADDVADTPLRGVDNIHVSRSGDLFVAEDSYTNDPDAMDVCIITPTARCRASSSWRARSTGCRARRSPRRSACASTPAARGSTSAPSAASGTASSTRSPGRSGRRVRRRVAPGAPVGLEVAKRLRAAPVPAPRAARRRHARRARDRAPQADRAHRRPPRRPRPRDPLARPRPARAPPASAPRAAGGPRRAPRRADRAARRPARHGRGAGPAAAALGAPHPPQQVGLRVTER